jgi:hypothetical protein
MELNGAYGNKVLNLDEKIFNGRVDLLGGENTKLKMDMMEKTAFKNKATTYCDSMKGQWEDNVLSQVFFCKENIQIIQNAIRANVYKLSGDKYVVSQPNIDNLQIIMRSYFMSFVEFYDTNITKQVEKLNQMVIDYCSKELYSAGTFYLKYLGDQSGMYMPHKRELQHDRNYKQLQLKDWV